jgi:regulator of protease activity HflC (stomatin/prohibitin superfamily)
VPFKQCKHCPVSMKLVCGYTPRFFFFEFLQTKTRDNVFVDVTVAVQYQIERENAYDAFYKLTDSRAQILSYVYDELRAQIPKIDLDQVFLAKEEIATLIKTELTKSMSGFGFQIIQTVSRVWSIQTC